MMQERRNDLGMKIVISVFSGIIMLLISLFVNAVWVTANEGKNKAFEIGERVTAIEAKFSSISQDLTEIKDLLRRKVPN